MNSQIQSEPNDLRELHHMNTLTTLRHQLSVEHLNANLIYRSKRTRPNHSTRPQLSPPHSNCLPSSTPVTSLSPSHRVPYVVAPTTGDFHPLRFRHQTRS